MPSSYTARLELMFAINLQENISAQRYISVMTTLLLIATAAQATFAYCSYKLFQIFPIWKTKERTIHFLHLLYLSCIGQVLTSYDYSARKWKLILQNLNRNFLCLTFILSWMEVHLKVAKWVQLPIKENHWVSIENYHWVQCH